VCTNAVWFRYPFVIFVIKGDRPLREPSQCWFAGQERQQRRDGTGRRPGLWRCDETTGNNYTTQLLQFYVTFETKQFQARLNYIYFKWLRLH